LRLTQHAINAHRHKQIHAISGTTVITIVFAMLDNVLPIHAITAICHNYVAVGQDKQHKRKSSGNQNADRILP
jgi:hypothetical protein